MSEELEKCFKCGEEAAYDVSINGQEISLCGACMRKMLKIINSDPEHINKIEVSDDED